MIARLATQTFRDRRTPEQLGQEAAINQEVADLRLEQLWRTRVAENERRRLNAKVIDITGRIRS